MRRVLGLLCCTLLALAACGREAGLGFRLPDGNADAGREAFVALHCNVCHEVPGVPIEHLGGMAHVRLGGATTRVRTYGEFVTSIINPSHRIAPMHRDGGATPEGESVMTYVYLSATTLRHAAALETHNLPVIRFRFDCNTGFRR